MGLQVWGSAATHNKEVVINAPARQSLAANNMVV